MSTVAAASSFSSHTRAGRTGRRSTGFTAAGNAGSNAGFAALSRGSSCEWRETLK